jgi:hypothetical protein
MHNKLSITTTIYTIMLFYFLNVVLQELLDFIPNTNKTFLKFISLNTITS